MTSPGLKASPEYQEALLQLYHSVLPNVPLETLQEDLSKPEVVHYMLFRTEEAVREDYRTRPARLLRRYRGKAGPGRSGQLNIEEYSGETDADSDTGEDLLVKAEEYVRSKKKAQFEKTVRQALPGLLGKLTGTKADLALLDAGRVTVRPKDMLVGAASVGARTVGGVRVAQLLCVGVRARFQLARVGRRLLRTAVSLEGAGVAAVVAAAPPGATRFLRNGGLTDDPLLAGRFAPLTAPWPDATPMVLLTRPPPVPPAAADERWEAYRAEAYQRYATEAFFVRQLIEEADALRQRLTTLERAAETFDQQLALERSRCVMYEQLVQSLEAQLLAAGIKPRVDQDEIIQRVVDSAAKAGAVQPQ